MEEAWKDIPGYEGLYQASTIGRIRTKPGKTTSNKRYKARTWQSRIMKHKFKVNGKRHDAAVTLWKDGKPKDHLVSRLVAMTWVDGYLPNLTVNHIDGNPRNNRCENLEWLTLSENVKKGFEEGLYESIQIPVLLKSDTEEFPFCSMAEASRFLHRSNGYVSNCLKINRPITDVSGTHYDVFFKAVKSVG